MKTKRFLTLAAVAVTTFLLPALCQAQVNSGSNGSDGAFNPTTNIVINMADHPNGIYQYTSVNIPNGETVTFTPNANNTSLTWLVQSNVVINGAVNVSGQSGGQPTKGSGGPGGWSGGVGGTAGGSGQGPGGGAAGFNSACSASYGESINCNGSQPGYGNQFLIPLIGGSGGGGATNSYGGGAGGGGGGGAILIATSAQIQLNGSIAAIGGYGRSYNPSTYIIYAGGGSGGAVRLVASTITGGGSINTSGGGGARGRVRFDSYGNDFSGSIVGIFSQGSQFVIIPTSGQLPQLTVTSVGGVQVSASPSGQINTPDAVLSAQQNNPISVVVSCANLPLNTQITVSIKPVNGVAVSATGYNSTGTLASSTATISIVIPRGGGLIYATAATN